MTTNYMQQIEDCEEHIQRLTRIEKVFLEAAALRLTQDMALTEKQVEALNILWNKCTVKS